MAGDTQQLLQRALLGEAIDLLEGVAVFVWNEERHYVAVNEEACRLVGMGRDELIGMPVGELTVGHAAEEMGRVRDAPFAEGTLRFTRRSGEEIELAWTTIHTRVAGLPYMVSICRRRDG